MNNNNNKKPEMKQNKTPPNCNQIKLHTHKKTMESMICLLVTPEHESCAGFIDI